MVELGFTKADSTNIPKIDIFMVAEFVKNDARYNAAEIRLVKASLSSRESYGDTAIGYVCLRRESSICIIKGKICPEHRVKSKKYAVTLIVNTEDEIVENVICEDCAASLGGCKHALAFLMWLHRKSEHRSPTEVECYWNKPILSTVGTTIKYIEVSEICKGKTPIINNLPDNSTFLRHIMTKAKENQIDSQLSRHSFSLSEREMYSLSLHQLLLKFLKTNGTSASDFMHFASSEMTKELCFQVEKETKQQSDSLLWHELRYGRITASVIHEAAHCGTKDGSFVQRLLGASKKFDSKEMRRGRYLEKVVIEEVQKQINEKLVQSGFIIIPEFPIFGASPDAMGDDFVVEVKCPNSEKTFVQYISRGNVTAKYKAQIHLQMLAAKTKKGLFCVADSNFEENKKINLIWVHFDHDYMFELIDRSMTFWKENVFCKMRDSIMK